MKKLVVSLLAALLVLGGLVAATVAPASAACPYEGCSDTVTVGAASVAPGASKAKVRARVRAVDSNRTPVGTVRLTVKKRGTSKVLFSQTKKLKKGAATFTTKKLKRGRYQFAVQYKKKADSGFNNSLDKGNFKIG